MAGEKRLYLKSGGPGRECFCRLLPFWELYSSKAIINRDNAYVGWKKATNLPLRGVSSIADQTSLVVEDDYPRIFLLLFSIGNLSNVALSVHMRLGVCGSMEGWCGWEKEVRCRNVKKGLVEAWKESN